MLTMKVMRLHDDVKLPERKTAGASGFDLPAYARVRVWPGKAVLVETGLAFEIPLGFEGHIRPRSGLAEKSIVPVFGTIDSDYRGEIKVRLMNLSNILFDVEAGMRVAQLVIAPVALPALVEVKELSPTTRGDKGFGSTGLH